VRILDRCYHRTGLRPGIRCLIHTDLRRYADFFRSSLPFSSSAAYAAAFSVFTTTTRTTVDFCCAIAAVDNPSINTSAVNAIVIFLSTFMPLSFILFSLQFQKGTTGPNNETHYPGRDNCAAADRHRTSGRHYTPPFVSVKQHKLLASRHCPSAFGPEHCR